ncbi:MAG: methylated-DNA--[protein]-cysteine S-methyltransferase, partial [Pseudomonadota bacterium]|nr:methylated-DNA--[protein]-cysteine S-methyltransferase [Pseudomonadota bacterium]
MTARCSTTFVSWFASPLGLLWIQHDGHFILSVDYIRLGQSVDWSQAKDLPESWQQAFSDYFSGETTALAALPIRLDIGTVFQRDVWLALQQIPAGTTWTYAKLAKHIGRPKAIRAVGQALSKNPLSIVLPCHRVIRQSGELGGYAGNSDVGRARKQFLLWHECGF